MQRLELLISVDNPASQRDRREDTEIWSRLGGDP
jgi:hypothetical protein